MSLPRQTAVDRPREVLRPAAVSADGTRVRRVEEPVSRSGRRQLQSQLHQTRRYIQSTNSEQLKTRSWEIRRSNEEGSKERQKALTEKGKE